MAYRLPVLAVYLLVALPPVIALVTLAPWTERGLLGIACLMAVCMPVICLAGICVLAGFLRFTHAAHADLCRKCGYDLRGSPGPICPECGTERSRQADTKQAPVRLRSAAARNADGDSEFDDNG